MKATIILLASAMTLGIGTANAEPIAPGMGNIGMGLMTTTHPAWQGRSGGALVGPAALVSFVLPMAQSRIGLGGYAQGASLFAADGNGHGHLVLGTGTEMRFRLSHAIDFRWGIGVDFYTPADNDGTPPAASPQGRTFMSFDEGHSHLAVVSPFGIRISSGKAVVGLDYMASLVPAESTLGPWAPQVGALLFVGLRDAPSH